MDNFNTIKNFIFEHTKFLSSHQSYDEWSLIQHCNIKPYSNPPNYNKNSKLKNIFVHVKKVCSSNSFISWQKGHDNWLVKSNTLRFLKLFLLENLLLKSLQPKYNTFGDILQLHNFLKTSPVVVLLFSNPESNNRQIKIK